MNKCEICKSKENIIIVPSGVICYDCVMKGFKIFIQTGINRPITLQNQEV